MCERILLERDNPTTSQIDCGDVGLRSSTQPTDPKSPRLPVPQSRLSYPESATFLFEPGKTETGTSHSIEIQPDLTAFTFDNFFD